jgi:hypothetical protein
MVASDGVIDWMPLIYALLAVVAWFLLQVVLERFLPADVVSGSKLRDG